MLDISSLHTLFEKQDINLWKSRVNKALKGQEFKEALVRNTRDGIKRGPLFIQSQQTDPNSVLSEHFLKLSQKKDFYQPWRIRQNICCADPQKANRILLSELKGGASALLITLDPSGQTGVRIRNIEDLRILLKEVDPSLASIEFSPSPFTARFYLALLICFLEKEDFTSPPLMMGGGFSPLDDRLQTGLSRFLEKDTHIMIAYFKKILEKSLPIRLLTIDASLIHHAGGTPTQEIAYALSSAIYYLSQFEKEGLSADLVCPYIEFRFAATQDIHLTISKLRAARECWYNILIASHVPAEQQECYQTALTSKAMLSAQHTETNLIRQTLASFAAIAGGIDSLTILPHTDIREESTTFSRRIIRNLQLLLHLESHMGQVTDPVHGSYFHEYFTKTLADKSWCLFQSIEQQGGLKKEQAFQNFLKNIRHAKGKLEQQYACRQRICIGINLYPFDQENKKTPPPISEVPPASEKKPLITASTPEILLRQAKEKWDIPIPVYKTDFRLALPSSRNAAPFEALKKRAALYYKNKEAILLPIILLEPLSDCLYRIQFAEQVFKIAGIKTKNHELSSFLAKPPFSPTPICLCGSNKIYNAELVRTIEKLKQQYKIRNIWLSNGPTPWEYTHSLDRNIHILSSHTPLIKELDLVLKDLGA